MKRAALLLVLCGSCAFFESAMKPTSVGLGAGLGAVVGGPAGAGVGGAAISAAWDVVDAEEREEETQEKLDVITNAALRGELAPLDTAIEAQSAKIERIIFWLFVSLVLYIFKQPIWAALTRRRIKKHVQPSHDEKPTETPQ